MSNINNSCWHHSSVIAPSMLFLDAAKNVSLSFLMVLNSDPLIWLFSIINICNEKHLLRMYSGTLPEKLLLPSINCIKFDISPIEAGIGPSNLLCEASKTSKRGKKNPTLLGSSPCNLLFLMDNFVI
ncbi:hypothetical protein V8G54_027638 [Vigna mungo]|uniref:Uncharacterized protein n=1 Tax=Vigna mungo TaxID=3915 RepID=A0AAQ3RN92_VIGMU